MEEIHGVDHLGASGNLWLPLGASGNLWEPLGASGSFWEYLRAAGNLWDKPSKVLGLSESSWQQQHYPVKPYKALQSNIRS
jgi:hypothetical protein